MLSAGVRNDGGVELPRTLPMAVSDRPTSSLLTTAVNPKVWCRHPVRPMRPGHAHGR